MKLDFDPYSRVYIVLLSVVALSAGGLAIFSDSSQLGLSAAILGLYVLHLYSMQLMQRQWQTMEGLERVVGELGAGDPSDEEREIDDEEIENTGGQTVRRDFKLGTVAVIKGVMSPGIVSEVMSEHRRRPGLTFGDHAVELGHLTETELEELMQVKHRGVYTPGEIRRARRRIEEYRSSVRPDMPGT